MTRSMQAFGQKKNRIVAIGLSFGIGLCILVLKFYVYGLTQSAAVLSDALESIINVVASAFAGVSVLVASRPPDPSHPYGHGKIEPFSAGFEGALIILAAMGIFKTGISQLLEPVPLPHLNTGLLLLLAAGLVNLILGLGLVRVGRSTRSMAIEADGKHVLTDVYTSAGMLVGLFLVSRTGWLWLDGAMACLMGVNILFSGTRLVRKSFSMLMDAADQKLLKEIAQVLLTGRGDMWIDIHQLRAWTAGAMVHVDFHLVLPRDLSLEEAHSEGKRIEKVLLDHFRGEASVLIHLDPCTAEDCPICGKEGCDCRVEDLQKRPQWTLKTLTKMAQAGMEDKALASKSPLP